MIDSKGFEFKTNIFNNQVYINPGKKTHIEIHLKNTGAYNLEGYIVDIECPIKALVNKKRKGFGTVSRKDTKTHVLYWLSSSRHPKDTFRAYLKKVYEEIGIRERYFYKRPVNCQKFYWKRINGFGVKKTAIMTQLFAFALSSS